MSEMDQAIRQALELNEVVARDGTGAAYLGLEQAMKVFQQQGYPLESIVPGGGGAALGFSIKGLSGQAFFDTYAKLLRKNLCAPNGEFNKLIRSGLSSSVGAVLTAIVTALGVPLVALGVMIPIAVILAHTGLDAFCAVTDEDK